ncbi:dephospho-CoA kinase [Ordospora colligata]|uniref:Dephospho-CoA kinase n=1 Tax=Ordospora colligata OC4 TaxID=1354746 RepID=A0A0B2UHX3_9MICR|nr:dephospho-CoA kinase [Ordospora colligata OC4]KHN68794.1 dephospho-CoA kinase [Ordospora colligata OC4]TBU13828.1 dephospho-CoA kinase [Ordospora colligata]TBU14017.1 dephospho-CoA kinase [Ordospora colligata]TBU17686.1 dephospho-CoA kinase [Ordospora colligata]
MRIIAITGGVGTGKTTMLEMLRDRGFATINTDEVTHQILKDINVECIRKRFFTDKRFRMSHTRRMMPRICLQVILSVLWLFIKGHSVVFIEIPLLFELGLHRLFYTVIVVCNKNLQIERGKKMSYLNERMAMQIPLEKKIMLAQRIIYNNSTIDSLRKQIKEIRLNGCNIYYCIAIFLTVIFLIVCE